MFGYFITALAGIFWIFRLIVALMFTTDASFPIVPINMTFEIIVLFVTFVCIIFIAKEKMIGSVIYLIAQCAYFGVDAYKALEVITSGQAVQTSNYITLFISFIAIIIPVLAIMNIGLSSGKKGSMKNRKTDWFYGTTDYDRNLDDRADKNQYKF